MIFPATLLPVQEAEGWPIEQEKISSVRSNAKEKVSCEVAHFFQH